MRELTLEKRSEIQERIEECAHIDLDMLHIAHRHRRGGGISSPKSDAVLVRSEGAEINRSCLQVVHPLVRKVHCHSSSIGSLI